MQKHAQKACYQLEVENWFRDQESKKKFNWPTKHLTCFIPNLFFFLASIKYAEKMFNDQNLFSSIVFDSF